MNACRVFVVTKHTLTLRELLPFLTVEQKRLCLKQNIRMCERPQTSLGFSPSPPMAHQSEDKERTPLWFSLQAQTRAQPLRRCLKNCHLSLFFSSCGVCTVNTVEKDSGAIKKCLKTISLVGKDTTQTDVLWKLKNKCYLSALTAYLYLK